MIANVLYYVPVVLRTGEDEVIEVSALTRTEAWSKALGFSAVLLAGEVFDTLEEAEKQLPKP